VFGVFFVNMLPYLGHEEPKKDSLVKAVVSGVWALAIHVVVLTVCCIIMGNLDSTGIIGQRRLLEEISWEVTVKAQTEISLASRMMGARCVSDPNAGDAFFFSYDCVPALSFLKIVFLHSYCRRI
jgi:hypothetical protein